MRSTAGWQDWEKRRKWLALSAELPRPLAQVDVLEVLLEKDSRQSLSLGARRLHFVRRALLWYG